MLWDSLAGEFEFFSNKSVLVRNIELERGKDDYCNKHCFITYVNMKRNILNIVECHRKLLI